MSDELEPFRRAAELGCPYFINDEIHGLSFLSEDGKSFYALPFKGKNGALINRRAAAVCAEWWVGRLEQDDQCDSATFDMYRKMIVLCREFGRKHGGE